MNYTPLCCFGLDADHVIDYESIVIMAIRELDAETEAQSLYDEYIISEAGRATISQIGDLFPDYNTVGGDTDAAAEHIVKDMEITLGDRFTDDEWAAVEEKLYELGKCPSRQKFWSITTKDIDFVPGWTHIPRVSPPPKPCPLMTPASIPRCPPWCFAPCQIPPLRSESSTGSSDRGAPSSFWSTSKGRRAISNAGVLADPTGATTPA